LRIVLQRVLRAAVEVDGEELARIGPGLLALVCVARGDDAELVRRAAQMVAGLRLFEESDFGETRRLRRPHRQLTRDGIERGGDGEEDVLIGQARRGIAGRKLRIPGIA
jgi:hypothetical protein